MIVGTHSYTWVNRGNVEQSFLYKETSRRQRLGSNHRPPGRKSNALTTRPPRLHNKIYYWTSIENGSITVQSKLQSRVDL